MSKPRMLVSFSCGVASAVAAKIAVDQYADCFRVEVCYCDTSKDEHEDNQRFLCDVERWIGQRVTILRSEKYQTVSEVQRGQRFIVSPNGAPCTKILKRKVFDDYATPNDTYVLGFTVEEHERIAKFEKRHKGIDCEWVLRDRGLTKADCITAIKGAGIELPAMYRLGYHNNNCIGCVKGGMGYWNKIRRDFPERFNAQAGIEREIGATILRRNGQPLYLDELEPDAGRHEDIDTGDCGVFCEMNTARVTRAMVGGAAH